MRKKAHAQVKALVMALVMLFTTIAVPLMNPVSAAADESEGLKIQFHYLREDGNYDGWDIFGWDGISGAEFQKDDNGYVTDKDGAVAETVVAPGSTKVGFIVRVNDWSDREQSTENDGNRFVDVSGYASGTIHVYVKQGDLETYYNYDEAVKGEYVDPATLLKVQFHYDREDGNYEGWSIHGWGGASSCTFDTVDEYYGAMAETTVAAGSEKIGYIVKYSTPENEWAGKDWDGDRFIDVAGYTSGTIHVYITQGQEEVVVNYNEAVKNDPLTINFTIDKVKEGVAEFGLWLWDDIGTPALNPLFGDGLSISYQAAPGATWVGIIVRDKDWGKYPDGDRQVDVSKYVGGVINVGLTLNESEMDVDYSNAVEGAKIKSAVYEGNKIIVKTSLPLESLEDPFNVLCAGTRIPVKEIVASENENEYIVSFEKDLDRTKAYEIAFNGSKYDVSMPSLYKDEAWIAENTYTGKDLGATWTKEATTFRVWAPLASEVSVNLYKEGEGDNKIATMPMSADVNGTWVLKVEGDQNGVYYTYTVNNSGKVVEACDPYAVTTGINGNRAMVIDLDSTDPEGWENDKNPNTGKNFTDAIIYELHVRDASIHESSGVSAANKGNFLGLTEHGPNTILDHMVDLGITHLHLLPVYDINSVDEKTDGFNWGYDPKNYNVPEGSYSSDPYNGEVRVKEMKEMVQTLHENGISVIMDVVYNHVADAGNFCFNQIVPNYFSRMNENGGYNSNSGCGNDTASEHVMVRKYIVESVKYWAEEYHIDGFRFDLVGLIDTVTINELMKEVWSVYPDVVFYGEGWEMNSYDTGVSMTVQNNASEVPGFAFFNDTFRDTLKGSVFDNTLPGWASGLAGQEATMITCFMGATKWGSAQTVCPTPLQTINYTSCHDNNTLYDRLKLTWPDASEETIIKMNNLITAVTLTSQGVPFLHAGEDFLRSKPLPDGGYDHNSYASGDEINSIKWDTLEENKDVYEYYKGLIAFRKAHAALRMTDAKEVAENITAIEGLDANVLAFVIDQANGEKSDGLFVVFNPNEKATTVALPDGNWNVYVNAKEAGTEPLASVTGSVTVEGISAMVLVSEPPVVPQKGEEITKEDVTIAEDNKTSEVVKENDKEYVVLGNEAMKDMSIKADKAVIAEDAFFARKYVESGAIFEAAKEAVENKLEKVDAFKTIEINLYDGDAKSITELKDYVAVTIPVPADMEEKEGYKLVVYRLKDDGNMVYCPTTVKDGEITFETNHFSTFVIVEQAEEAVIPETGDNANFVLWIALLGLGVVAMAGAFATRKRTF